jgi:Arc/MetJ-type ribon-helix-helix transcriptional regulator
MCALQGDKMQRITIRLPEQQINTIEMLVQYGEAPSASELIRMALSDFLGRKSNDLLGKIKLVEAQNQIKSAESFLRMKEQV